MFCSSWRELFRLLQGVSSWVNQIIRGFPEIRFGAILGSRAQDYGDLRYALPDNLVHLEVTYLFEDRESPPVMQVKMPADTLAMVERVHSLFETDFKHPDCPHLLASLMDEAGPDGKLTHDMFLYSKAAWDMIKKTYRRRSTDPSLWIIFGPSERSTRHFGVLREVVK